MAWAGLACGALFSDRCFISAIFFRQPQHSGFSPPFWSANSTTQTVFCFWQNEHSISFTRLLMVNTMRTPSEKNSGELLSYRPHGRLGLMGLGDGLDSATGRNQSGRPDSCLQLHGETPCRHPIFFTASSS